MLAVGADGAHIGIFHCESNNGFHFNTYTSHTHTVRSSKIILMLLLQSP